MSVTFNPAATTAIDLDELESGSIEGISPRWGGALAEAAIVCFEQQSHLPGVSKRIEGACSQQVAVNWNPSGDVPQRWRAWGDPDEATEHGAYAIATLLVTGLTDHTVIERARKGKGFDYWLARKDSGPLFQRAARLEASGLRSSDTSGISSRVSRKRKQISVSDDLKLPGLWRSSSLVNRARGWNRSERRRKTPSDRYEPRG